ncbi:unnamed protein product [Rhizopus stolonifer]
MDHILSGWLYKLSSSNKFKSSKWQSRYFVLLDTELRYYQNEHSVDTSSTINLRDVSNVIKTSSFNHNYCFKLETNDGYKKRNSKCLKTWTMECYSENELNIWLAAINLRLSNLKHTSHIIKSKKPTISRRRGIVLNPLELESMPVLDHHVLSSASSKESVLSSPLEALASLSNKMTSQNSCIFSSNKYSSDSLL